jgi:hypothetical protein
MSQKKELQDERPVLLLIYYELHGVLDPERPSKISQLRYLSYG